MKIFFTILFGIGLLFLIFKNIDNKPKVVGGDRDENGCIGSAGYSWCKAKVKCIRIFEEDCESELGMKTALAKKYNKTPDKVFIKISKETPQYASGSVKFDVNDGPGGMFLATKISDKWEIVFDGNGAVNCEQIQSQYLFPVEILEGFCD